MNRGYEIMYDAEDYSALLKENISDREDMVSALNEDFWISSENPEIRIPG